MQTTYSWAKKPVRCHVTQLGNVWNITQFLPVIPCWTLVLTSASFVHPYFQLVCFHKSLFGLVSSGSCFCLTSSYWDGFSFSKQEEIRAAIWLGNCLESFGGLLGGCAGDYRGERAKELTLGYLLVLSLPVYTCLLSYRHCLFCHALVQPVKLSSPNRKSLNCSLKCPFPSAGHWEILWAFIWTLEM